METNSKWTHVPQLQDFFKYLFRASFIVGRFILKVLVREENYIQQKLFRA